MSLPKRDWAFSVMRQFLYDAAETVRLTALSAGTLVPLAQLTTKLRGEEKYHVMHGRTWVLRLGRGTEESREKMQHALALAYPCALALFEPTEADEVLDPEALTIGFARRFAPYKRATLFTRNPERLLEILCNPQRPVQIIVAGKAHPRDDLGKELIKNLVTFARRPEVQGKIVFLEDYDLSVAEYMVQGVDVWLNTPKKRHEACGTSGMKVPPNGGINLSIRDGWWAEAYDGENGWAIGDDRDYNNDEYHDFVESEAIYDLLEQEIVPLFYDRGAAGVPRRWIAKVKTSMRSLLPRFNTNRMVREYTDLYRAALSRWSHLIENDCAVAKDLAAWRASLSRQWEQIRVESVESSGNCEYRVGSAFDVTAEVFLGDVAPDQVEVQLYHGRVNGSDHLVDGQVIRMEPQGDAAEGRHRFVGKVACATTGHRGYTVRILPYHPDLGCPHCTGLIRWG